jgi:hypothetical protein
MADLFDYPSLNIGMGADHGHGRGERGTHGFVASAEVCNSESAKVGFGEFIPFLVESDQIGQEILSLIAFCLRDVALLAKRASNPLGRLLIHGLNPTESRLAAAYRPKAQPRFRQWHSR